MNGDGLGFEIFLLWLVSGVLMMTGAAVAFFWALRSGQFRNQDRARYLALWSGIPKDREAEEGITGAAGNAADCKNEGPGEKRGS